MTPKQVSIVAHFRYLLFITFIHTQRHNHSPYNGNSHHDESILCMLDLQKIHHSHKYFSLYNTLPPVSLQLLRYMLVFTFQKRLFIKRMTQRKKNSGHFLYHHIASIILQAFSPSFHIIPGSNHKMLLNSAFIIIYVPAPSKMFLIESLPHAHTESGYRHVHSLVYNHTQQV